MIEADGSAYPCDFYVTTERKLGMIQESTLSELMERGLPFLQESLPVPEACHSCPYAAACKGGCRRDRIFKDGLPVENYFCPGYKRFFGHAWPLLNALAQRERQAYQNA